MHVLLSQVLLLAVTLGGQEPIVYQEGFESGEAKWSVWAKNAERPCTVNFVGPTDEKAFAGKRSLKLDLTFHEGSYCYFGAPVKVPAAGDLRLSGYLNVDEMPAEVRVGLGWNVSLPPSGHSGCAAIETLQWEGYREGVDDTRYLATLLEAIRTAEPGQKDVAEAARRWLVEVDVSGDLDAIRREMIGWILELGR
jgi:hypothetical protein